ncbi:MAG: glycosyltransferase family A protein [Chromatiales bacterium]|jgi:GT2 family glycosyltransferase
MSGGGVPRPLVSVAIPLWRSRVFVERILANISALAGLDVEVLVSDRHQDDDALDRLRRHLAGDRRIRFLSGTDRLSWVDHYNLLLTEARGRYFMWMPHDDEFPGGYVSGLVDSLEADPAAVLAFGEMHKAGEPGGPASRPAPPVPAPLRRNDPWSRWMPLKLLVLWNPGLPFRGLFRRDRVMESGLVIKPSNGNVRADVYWVFALSLLGPLRFVGDVHCIKHYHGSNTHTRWVQTPSTILDRYRLPRAYMRDARPRSRHPLRAYRLLLAVDTLYHLVTRFTPVPAGLLSSRLRRLLLQ